MLPQMLIVTLLAVCQVWGLLDITLSYRINSSRHYFWGIMEFEGLLVK